MGEAKKKSRRRDLILLDEPNCIYCPSSANSVEHMPPIGMFMNNHRPSGLEFSACKKCNNSTRASDAAAAFFARISPTQHPPKWALEESYKLVGTIAQLAPQCVREIFDNSKDEKVWAKGRDSLFSQMHRLKLDGPVTHALMTTFAAKLGMALFREHTGRRLSSQGGIYTQFYFNSGLTKNVAENILSILPLFDQLKQGKIESGKQFNYRFNTDNKDIFGGFVAFHDNLFVRVFAVNEPTTYAFLADEYNANFVPFGGLEDLTKAWR